MIGLLGKLAYANLLNNRRLYLPFALATIVSSAIFYVFCALAANPFLSEVYGADTIKVVLSLGTVVVVITVGMIIFYANGVVLKNRSQELGLYGILGLTKSNLVMMHAIESILFSFTTICLGLGIGVLLDRLFYALLLKLMHMEVVLTSVFQFSVLLKSFILLSIVFFLAWLINSRRLMFWSSLDFKKEKRAGEKKGRFLLFQAFLGLVFLLLGYVMALSVEDPINAVLFFFVAVLLVIGGTYFLFIAGTNVFLNWLKRREKFYYQVQNMIAVSNLTYRLKKNAIGLATIAILSSMILVTMVGSSSIYLGTEKTLQRSHPYDYGFELYGEEEKKLPEIETIVENYLKKEQVPIQTMTAFKYEESFAQAIIDNKIDLLGDYHKAYQTSQMPKALIYILALSDYQALTGDTKTLGKDEVLVYDNKGQFSPKDQLELDKLPLTIKGEVKDDVAQRYLPNPLLAVMNREIVLVLSDENRFFNQQGDKRFAKKTYIGVDTTLSQEEMTKLDLESTTRDELGSQLFTSEERMNHDFYFHDKTAFQNGIYALVGSILFIGILLSLTFTLGVVLVIYYKQISEGLEDRANFVILNKLGLDEKQVGRIIRHQVLTVFFLPLLVALVHFAFAFKMLKLILQLLGAGQLNVILLSVGVVGLSFVAIYVFVYLATSHSYKRIVMK